jgi:hypothetical protein
MVSGQQDPAAMQLAFNTFAGLLATPEGRDQVRQGAWQEALVEAGADPTAIPAELLETVAGMSDEEMEMISSIQSRLGEGFPGIELCIIF